MRLGMAFALFLYLYQPIFAQNTEGGKVPPMLSFAQFAPMLQTQSDTVYVYNFWATWCAPCVAELPHFEQLNQKFADKKVKVVLVCLDFKNQIQTKLLPFLAKKNIQSSVICLVEHNANAWIPKVDKDWSGSIPATLIFDKNKRKFMEKEFDTYADIEKELTSFMAQ